MAEQLGSAVAGEVVSTAASFLTKRFEELTGVPDKIQWLEWKLLKIDSAIMESYKYDIENEALEEMRQKLVDAGKEGNRVLKALKYSSAVANLQRSDQAIELQNPITAQRPRSQFTVLAIHVTVFLTMLIQGSSTSHYVQNLLSKLREIQKLNRMLERIEGMSEDIGDFLEMLRQQKRKRGRRRRYKPYFSFINAYLELAQDALSYWWAHVSWMQYLVPEITAFVETKAEFELKAGETKLYGISKYCLML